MSGLGALSDELEALVARASRAVVGVEQGRGAGTGVVIARDGYLLTNHHVAGSGRSLRVRLPDGEAVKAELVGSDAPTDLAVVRVRTEGLSHLALAASVRVGQLVVAIGNPFRFERSVSVGIVSATDRSLPGPGGAVFEGLVQTDAAINPGNSGGPLVNVAGEVVGINTAVIPWAQGMGFAVSSRTANWVASVLIQKGSIERRRLGVAARSELLAAEVASATGQPRAVRVLQVSKGSAADAAGLHEEDLVLGVHGEPVANVDDIHRLMVLRAADAVPLALWRGGERIHLVALATARQAA
ncbi:MAG TPA: trypsin-like peptidase domain-containing protein [Myxococcaceae bacterium]|nr:trypsin-like peptidase domain-containing protein [Myxococcaceae bacterium]